MLLCPRSEISSIAAAEITFVLPPPLNPFRPFSPLPRCSQFRKERQSWGRRKGVQRSRRESDRLHFAPSLLDLASPLFDRSKYRVCAAIAMHPSIHPRWSGRRFFKNAAPKRAFILHRSRTDLHVFTFIATMKLRRSVVAFCLCTSPQ